MKNWFNRNESPTRNQLAMDEVYDYLESLNPSDKDYTEAVKNLTTLNALEHKPSKLDANKVMAALTYVAMGAAVLVFEAFGHTMTTKLRSLDRPKLDH